MQQIRLIQPPVNDDRQTSDGPRSRKHARAETLSEVESMAASAFAPLWNMLWIHSGNAYID